MAIIWQLTKQLLEKPVPAQAEGYKVRPFDAKWDIIPWLRLREAAFADQKPGVRPWTQEAFLAECMDKPWWNPSHCWLIYAKPDGESPSLAGSVMLASRSGQQATRPVVHWLMVDPVHRAKGLGRWLLTLLEQEVWRSGGRQIWLETHAGWDAAVRFYTASGYLPVIE